MNRETGKLHHHETWEDAYNDAFMRHAVARGTCDVNDIRRPYFQFAEDTVRDALTEEGVRHIFDELRVLHVIRNVAVQPIDAPDIGRLARVLLDGSALTALPDAERPELLRILSHALTMLVATGQAVEQTSGEAGGAGGFRMRVKPKPR
jgi:hypothetical protein